MSSSEEPASSMWAVQPSDGVTIAPEQLANFHRISVVIVNTGSRVLRKILLQELPSGQDLRAFLISNNSNLEELHRRRVITDPQMDLLQNNCPDLEKFDVTLLVCLLRNIVNVQAPATGWKMPPNPSDTSLGADLVRIRNWRNRIAHSSAVGMKNEEFNQLWNEVEPVLVRMNPEGEERNSIRQEIADGKQRLLGTFNEREKHLCDILVKWHKITFEDVDKNLKDVMDQFAELKLDVTSMRRERKADATDARLERDEISRTLGNMEQAWNQLQEESIPKQLAEAPLQQNRLDEAQTNLKIAESPENVAHRLSEEVRLLRDSLPTNIETWLNRIEEELRRIQVFLERQTSLSSEAMGNNQTERNQERHALAEVNQTQHRSSNGMTDIEIMDVVRKLSASWKMLAIHLGYPYTQTDALEEIYGNKLTNKIHAMLRKWHSVVMQFGEDPKLLLAKACCNIQNRLLATQILGEERFEREDLGNVKMSRPLEEAIKGITFDEQPDGRQQSSVSRAPASTNSTNYGGDSSVNIFGGKVKIRTIIISGGTGNSSTKRTVPEYGSGVRMADGSMNYGGSNSQNFFNADVEAEKVCIGQPAAEKNTNSSASGGYDETDTVRRTGREPDSAPDSATSLAGNFKVEHDNTLSEEIHDVINMSMKSVGMLRMTNSFGTAFRVGSKYAMTAWHMIRPCVDPLDNGRRDFNNLERHKAFINFSADPYSPIQQIFYISSTVPYFDVQLDIAVVELKIDNSVNPPPALPLCTEHEECKNVNKLKLLGFGHPVSVKKSEEFASVIPPESPRVKAAQAWVQQNEKKLKLKCRAMGKDPESFTWDYRGWDDDKNVAIDIYKEKGSSGSPAFLCADATKVKVMAVVYRGLPDCFWELPSSLRLVFPTYCRIELAVKMSHIYVSMEIKNPTLKNDVFQCDETAMEQ